MVRLDQAPGAPMMAPCGAGGSCLRGGGPIVSKAPMPIGAGAGQGQRQRQRQAETGAPVLVSGASEKSKSPNRPPRQW